jgi:hypothetical protein
VSPSKIAVKLYRRRRYKDLYDFCFQTQRGKDIFVELAGQDDILYEWWMKHLSEILEMQFKDPRQERMLKENLYGMGLGELFEIKRAMHKGGFATAEELAQMMGVTPEEVMATQRRFPWLFGGKVVPRDQIPPSL